MKVVQVRCPSCNSPIYSKQRDRMFYCDKCNVIHVRDGGVDKIDFDIAEFGSAPQGDSVYVPFWRLYCSFIIRSKSVEGGHLFRLASWMKSVPLPSATFKRLAIDFTVSSPKYSTRLNFGSVRRMPTSLSREEAAELADFIVVTMEAEKPGVLQRLDYTLTVNGTKMVYLPFGVGPRGMAPAL